MGDMMGLYKVVPQKKESLTWFKCSVHGDETVERVHIYVYIYVESYVYVYVSAYVCIRLYIYIYVYIIV